jgi:hypothetical protein
MFWLNLNDFFLAPCSPAQRDVAKTGSGWARFAIMSGRKMLFSLVYLLLKWFLFFKKFFASVSHGTEYNWKYFLFTKAGYPPHSLTIILTIVSQSSKVNLRFAVL